MRAAKPARVTCGSRCAPADPSGERRTRGTPPTVVAAAGPPPPRANTASAATQTMTPNTAAAIAAVRRGPWWSYDQSRGAITRTTSCCDGGETRPGGGWRARPSGCGDDERDRAPDQTESAAGPRFGTRSGRLPAARSSCSPFASLRAEARLHHVRTVIGCSRRRLNGVCPVSSGFAQNPPFAHPASEASGHGRGFGAESGSAERHRRLRQDDVMATTEGTGTNRWREELYEAKPERQGELFSTI